jgi:hypothetical protein
MNTALANCGHPATRYGESNIGAGPCHLPEGYTMCLDCGGADEVATLPYRDRALLYQDGATAVTTWGGVPAGKITRLTVSRSGPLPSALRARSRRTRWALGRAWIC